MITDKIKNLFQFIEYLHSNIENFNQHIDLINELWLLGEERKELRPERNYKDKLQYDKVQAEIEIKFDDLQYKTANQIRAKAKELNVCNFDEKDDRLNEISTDIEQLRKNFSNNDLSEIFKHKNQYIEFRKNEYRYFLSLYWFFFDLDRTTKALFDFFKEDSNQNEYEAFETKVIQVNNENEAFKLLQQGGLRAFNINPLKLSIIQQQTDIEPLLPQPLQTNLKTQQRANLFTELVNGGFIPDENPDCFNWAFAAKGETEPTPPGQWQPIKWEKSKWLLAYFVDLFNCEFLGNDGIKKRTQWKPFELLFGETGLRGSKNDYQKTGSLPDGYKQIEVIIKSLK